MGIFRNVDIGMIGAMDSEIEYIKSRLEDSSEKEFGGVTFTIGRLFGKDIAIARCGIGKVFAALCAEAMIVAFSPRIIINTGVGGALNSGISIGDIVVAEKLVQHDMDTSPLGDPKGLISGINKIYFEADSKGREALSLAAKDEGLEIKCGIIASGDRFVADKETKAEIVREFDASVCEMEGAAIAQVAFVNKTPFLVIRAVSDSADEESSVDYMEFLAEAAKKSARLTVSFCKRF